MADTRRGIQIGINAQILPQVGGGLVNALLALLRALGSLPDGDERYRLIVGDEEQEAFWRPKISANQDLVLKFAARPSAEPPTPAAPVSIRRRLRHVVGRAASPGLAPVKDWIRGIMPPPPAPRQWPSPAISNGFFERLNCDVMHFPGQEFVVCGMPTVYNPHDLQHLYYPQFFSAEELAWREAVYPVGCRIAQTVIVNSQWAKADFVRQYGLDPGKLQVIPEGPQLQFAASYDPADAEVVRKRYRLPDRYLIYPAITWPHKNHLRLFQALALLRDERGLTVPLVLTGSQHPKFWPALANALRELRLESQVHGLGFIPETDLRVIQQSALCLVQPSLFEASSLPMYDAWFGGIAVACSNATALPEQAGDAALLFDPFDVRSIADAVLAIATQPDVREDLARRGLRRLQDFDWGRTARAYRAVYRRAARVPLTDEDRWLLQWDWMGEPARTPATSDPMGTAS